MNALDVLILVFALASIAIGVWRGFIREGYSSIFLMLGLFSAYVFAPILTGLMFEWFKLFGLWALTTSFLVILFLYIVVGRMMSYPIFSRYIPRKDLQTWEKVGGGFYGLFNAWLIVMIFALVMDNTPSRKQDWVRGSQSMRWAFEFYEYHGLGLEDFAKSTYNREFKKLAGDLNKSEKQNEGLSKLEILKKGLNKLEKLTKGLEDNEEQIEDLGNLRELGKRLEEYEKFKDDQRELERLVEVLGEFEKLTKGLEDNEEQIEDLGKFEKINESLSELKKLTKGLKGNEKQFEDLGIFREFEKRSEENEKLKDDRRELERLVEVLGELKKLKGLEDNEEQIEDLGKLEKINELLIELKKLTKSLEDNEILREGLEDNEIHGVWIQQGGPRELDEIKEDLESIR